ncbi:hypothetical protein GCM10023346_22800 [Arthrobacter gyeryongensis]|uniref:Uncharacterized protein n=1 Tax=Arthrobacter gyeryongensis TaxID=1650592 RepID=A0ABP9SDZ7_9MICC
MIHRRIIVALVEEASTEIRPIVVVSHRPDHPRSHLSTGRFDDRPEFGVGTGLTLIGEVPGEDYGVGADLRRMHFRKELPEVGFTINRAVKGFRPSQQMGVAKVQKYVSWPRVLGLDELHYYLRVGRRRRLQCLPQ